MTQQLYRAVAALLDLARERPQDRPRAWRSLDRLLLTEEETETLTRCIAVDETGDDRRRREWDAWSRSLLLAQSLRGSDEVRTRGGVQVDLPSSRRLRLVRASSEPDGSLKEGT